MKQTREPEMFAPVLQPGGKNREAKAIYADILFLRSCGVRVIRAGHKHHLVNGQRMESHRLRAMAAQWREDQADAVTRKSRKAVAS